MKAAVKKSDYQQAKARETYRKIKAGRVVLSDTESWIFEAGRMAGAAEAKKKAKIVPQ
jgi:hypothetical protein